MTEHVHTDYNVGVETRYVVHIGVCSRMGVQENRGG